MARKTKLKTEQVSISNSEKDIGTEKDNENKKNIFNTDGELVIDVFETKSDFVVLAAIAGVQIKDLDISVDEDMMVIKGHRSDPHDHPEKKYFYQECYWGPFSRKIILPENIDTESAQAAMDKGMLTIKIPKIDAEKAKKTNNVEIS